MPLSYRIEVYKGASCAKLSVSGVQTKGGKRGEIKGFSEKSRKRMIDLFHKIPKRIRAQSLFVTLTYPKKYSDRWRDWKRDLDTFFKRVARKWPRYAAIWKLEFQKRGAPHFHILVFNIKYMPRDWLARVWYEIVGSGDPLHLKAGTQVKRPKSDIITMVYIAKYLSKGGNTGDTGNTGRVWGVRCYANLWIVSRSMSVPVSVFYAIRRTLRKAIEKKLGRRVKFGRASCQGMTAYIDSGAVTRLVAYELEQYSLTTT